MRNLFRIAALLLLASLSTILIISLARDATRPAHLRLAAKPAPH